MIKEHVDSPFTQYPDILEEPIYKVITNGLWADPEFPFDKDFPYSNLDIQQVREALESLQTGIQFVNPESQEREMVLWTGPEGHRVLQGVVQEGSERQISHYGSAPTDLDTLGESIMNSDSITTIRQFRTEEEAINYLDQISNNDI